MNIRKRTNLFSNHLHNTGIIHCDFCITIFSYNEKHNCIGSWKNKFSTECPLCDGRLIHILPDWDILIDGK